MTDPTRRDVRLGDLSALTAGESTRAMPRVGEGPSPAETATRRQKKLDAAPPPPAEEPERTEPRLKPLAAGPATSASSWPLFALGVVVVLLCGVIGWLLYAQTRTEAALAALEAKARASVETLESQVSSTSTRMRSADSETQKSLNLLAADIGRLNEGLNRLARALEAEAQARELVDRDLKGLATQSHEADLAAQKADAELLARLKPLSEGLDQLASRQKSTADTLARVERNSDAAQLRSELSVLSASVRQLQEDHEKRLRGAEQAAASNDAFRRQVNATIDRLIQQVNELYQRR